MTIKRKTQLNLSGSHRNLDADFAQIGSALFVTGSVSGSTGRFTYLSGALSASSTGLPFLVAGSNITANWSDTNLNWEITGSGGGGSVAPSDTFIQFNQNGAFAASSSLTHFSGTLGVHAISGSLTSSGTVFGDIGYNGNILKINTNVLVTQSFMLFDGVGSLSDLGGVLLVNGAKLTMFSGSVGEDPPFSVEPSDTPDQARLMNVGTADFVSGAVNLTFGSTLNVHSASQSGTGFAVIPDTTAGTVRLDINGRLFSNGTNISALTGSVRTGGAYVEPDSNVISGALLTTDMVNGSVGKFRVEVIGAAINGDQFISADLIVAASKSVAGVYGTFGVTEVTLDAIGTNALGWDVNINTNGDIAVTSSVVGVDWYAQVSKKMILSGSGIVIY